MGPAATKAGPTLTKRAQDLDSTGPRFRAMFFLVLARLLREFVEDSIAQTRRPREGITSGVKPVLGPVGHTHCELPINIKNLCGVPRRSFTANLHQFDASNMSWSPGCFPRDQQGYGVPVAVPLGLPHTRATQGSAAHQPGTGNTGFRHPPAEPHIRLNVRYGSIPDVE